MAKLIDEEQRKKVGVYLAHLREQEGLTQAQAAERAGISTAVYISMIENGRRMPTRKTLAKLARAYTRASLSEMLERCGYPAHPEALQEGLFGEEEIEGIEERGKPVRQSDRSPWQAQQDMALSPEGALPQGVALSRERLDWAFQCVNADPNYELTVADKSGKSWLRLKAVTVRLYQEVTGRQLLIGGELKDLDRLINNQAYQPELELGLEPVPLEPTALEPVPLEPASEEQES